MDFSENQPIYLQIIDFFCSRILEKKWTPDDRIPSVREIAVKMEVNPNTAMRAFHYLQEKEILFNQRGIGYFVSENAYKKVLELKRTEFISEKLPVFFRDMNLLGISFDELKILYDKFGSQSAGG